MNVVRRVSEGDACSLRVTDTPKGLRAIHREGCAAAIWQRVPLMRFQTWIDALPPEHLPKARMILAPDNVRHAMCDLCGLCGTPETPERAMLVDDIAALAHIFSAVMQAPYLRLRLDVIDTNACRRFHTDAVTARLICTYRGTGTQYGIAPDGTAPKHVSTVPTGAPILLRGSDWPEDPRAGLLHRSPPIEGPGETRLVLVLDPVLDPEGAPDGSRLH